MSVFNIVRSMWPTSIVEDNKVNALIKKEENTSEYRCGYHEIEAQFKSLKSVLKEAQEYHDSFVPEGAVKS